MILTIDIGNTNIVIGGFTDGTLTFVGRCSSQSDKTADEYALTIKGILHLHNQHSTAVEGGIISSVVPALRTVMSHAMTYLTGKTFLVVGAGIKTGLNIRMDNPAQLGSDLVVDAVAALAKYPKPVVFFDMGTAMTLSVIDQKGQYLGGMIIPGLRVSVDALSAQTAQLPNITLSPPERVIGHSTVECMQSGAIYGWAAMLEGLVSRVEEELLAPVTAVATGGHAALVASHCRREIIVDETLQLEGLHILYLKNQLRKK